MNEYFSITPLGAAIVDAMPDRKAVAKVKRDWRRNGKVPASTIFTQEQANKWARENRGAK